VNDQYRIADPAPPQQAPTGHYKLTSAALWIALAAGTCFNIGLQAAGLWLVAIPFGVIAAGSAIALIARAIVTGKRR
jgi:hypothetical protein